MRMYPIVNAQTIHKGRPKPTCTESWWAQPMDRDAFQARAKAEAERMAVTASYRLAWADQKGQG